MYYLVVIGQPRDSKGKFKPSICQVVGPYSNKSVIPLPMDFLSDYGNRKEKIYSHKSDDIHSAIEYIAKDSFVECYF